MRYAARRASSLDARPLCHPQAAADDLVRYANWLRGEAGPDTAERFLTAAEKSFGAIAETPGLGPSAGWNRGALGSLRKWRVRGFDVLIFYVEDNSGVAIIRVLHAAQNWMALLDMH